MTGLDTNVLVRYLLRDEPAQAARAAREHERDERFLISSVVLWELVWVLEAGYGLARTEIGATLEKILATAQFEVEGKDLALAALDDFRRSGADFSDCLVGRRNRAAGAVETVLRSGPARPRRLSPPLRIRFVSLLAMPVALGETARASGPAVALARVELTRAADRVIC